MELCFPLLKEQFKQDDGKREKERKRIEDEIETIKRRQSSLNAKFVDDLVSDRDYNQMKTQLEERYNNLVMQHASLGNEGKELSKQISFAFSLLSNLSGYYESARLELKQKLIGSMFPENLTFSDNNYRTIKINEAIEIIHRRINGFHKKNRGQEVISNDLPTLAPRPRLES